MSQEEVKTQISGGDGKRTTKTTGQSIKDSGVKIGVLMKFEKNPKYLEDRMTIFDEIMSKQKEEIASFPREDITITMPDGTVKEGKSFETTPMEIAKGISNSLAQKAVIAKVKFSS